MIVDVVMNAKPMSKNDRLSFRKALQGNLTLRRLRLIFLAIIAWGVYPHLTSRGIAEELTRCKYSVRDVAFVNVHGKSWQLRLVKPPRISAERFESWNLVLRNQLSDSNIAYAWHDSESDIGKQIRRLNPDADQLPVMDLVRLGVTENPVSVPSTVKLEEGLRLLSQSPARNEIFSKVVDDLCVFLLVESGDKSKDVVAKSELMAAVKRVNDQMWTLEKPTDSGPSVVVVPKSRRLEEKWLLSSLGIADDSQPAVAVIYGQGRLLGGVLFGDEITVDAIVTRASICGQDCECSLNRNWLYGVQILHRWDKTLERRSEESLDFDPNSAFVIAEVAQILQKNAGQVTQAPPVMLGGGLVIHDLTELDPDSNMESDGTESSPAKVPGTEEVWGGEKAGEEDGKADARVKKTKNLSETLEASSQEVRHKTVFEMPWAILIFFSGLVITGVFWLLSRT